MLIAHNSNSGTSSGNNNLVPSGSGSDSFNGNDVPAGPHRKVLDGEGSGVRNKDHSQLENKKKPSQEESKVIVPPTKTLDEVDK